MWRKFNPCWPPYPLSLDKSLFRVRTLATFVRAIGPHPRHSEAARRDWLGRPCDYRIPCHATAMQLASAKVALATTEGIKLPDLRYAKADTMLSTILPGGLKAGQK